MVGAVASALAIRPAPAGMTIEILTICAFALALSLPEGRTGYADSHVSIQACNASSLAVDNSAEPNTGLANCVIVSRRLSRHSREKAWAVTSLTSVWT